MKNIAVVAFCLVLAGCGAVPPPPAPTSAPSTTSTPINGEMVTRQTVEDTDRAIRLAVEELNRTCPPGQYDAVLCPRDGQSYLQKELAGMVDECKKFVGRYNILVQDGQITNERITLGSTHNARYGGMITCGA